VPLNLSFRTRPWRQPTTLPTLRNAVRFTLPALDPASLAMDEMRAIESFATFTAKESELLGRAEHALHRQPDELVHCLAYLGFALGFPWSQDEKLTTLTTLVAWLSLVEQSEIVVARLDRVSEEGARSQTNLCISRVPGIRRSGFAAGWFCTSQIPTI
jgi:hypothetical protein